MDEIPGLVSCSDGCCTDSSSSTHPAWVQRLYWGSIPQLFESHHGEHLWSEVGVLSFGPCGVHHSFTASYWARISQWTTTGLPSSPHLITQTLSGRHTVSSTGPRLCTYVHFCKTSIQMKKFFRKISTNIIHAFPVTFTCETGLAMEEVKAPLLPNALQHLSISTNLFKLKSTFKITYACSLNNQHLKNIEPFRLKKTLNIINFNH